MSDEKETPVIVATNSEYRLVWNGVFLTLEHVDKDAMGDVVWRFANGFQLEKIIGAGQTPLQVMRLLLDEVLRSRE